MGKGIETAEDKPWNKPCGDISLVPPHINIREVELVHGCDIQQAGKKMVHGLRLQEHMQKLGRPMRVEKWTVAKGRKVR